MKSEEHKLQSKIVIDFSRKRPEERGRLFATFSETESSTDGAIKTSLGLVKSTPDTFYIRKESGVACGIEIKALGTRHNTDHLRSQAKYLTDILKEGYFCDSLEIFWDIIEGRGGISPLVVLKNLESVTTKTVLWDKVRE